MTALQLVSIIVPCYNLALYLPTAIESVIAQTYGNWECIIVNDGSSDNTEEVAKEIVNKDDRFKYFKIDNIGLAGARNFAITQASGEYILPLDADDKIGADYLRLAVKAIQENESVKVVYCNAELFGEKSGNWDLPDFSHRFLASGNIIFCSALFRRNDWEKACGYDANMKYGWEDWELWISILKNGGEVVKLPYHGFFYRIRSNSMIRSLNQTQIQELYTYISGKHFDYIVANLGNPIDLYWKAKMLGESLDHITSRRPYKLYKKIKGLLSSK
jgi:glycosyltransferase involved in cell wall biosynthesis